MIIGPQRSCEIERLFVQDSWVDTLMSTKSSCIDQPGFLSVAGDDLDGLAGEMHDTPLWPEELAIRE